MNHVRPQDLIIIDIETVSCYPTYGGMTEEWQKLWSEKVKYSLPEDSTAEAFYEKRAGVMAEFSKIVCISMGYFITEENLKMRVKSYYGHDEKAIILSFLETITKIEKVNSKWCFAGHNIKEFDIPFICRRMIINDISLPPFMDFQNRKPWETNIVDTFQYWRFGDYKNFTSLKLLAAAVDVPSPKDDIDGSMVGRVYWQDNDVDRIAIYCQKDVVTVANIFLRFKHIPLLHPDDVEYIS